MAKTRLKIDADFNFILIGIVSPLQDYRMAWFINNVLHKALKKYEDHALTDEKNKRVMTFSRFYFSEEMTKSDFNLLRNKHELECLLPETKEIDYLLLISGDFYNSRKQELLKKLRTIEEVQAVVFLKPNELKSKNNLIFDDTHN